MGLFDGLSGGGIFGALTGSDKVYGRKPDPWVPYTPQQINQEYLDLTKNSQEQREDLASAANIFNQDQLFSLFDRAASGSRPIRTKQLSNIGDAVFGRLSPETLGNISRGEAAWAIDSGTGDSPMRGEREARDLGLTTMGLQRQGGMDLNDFLENTRRFYIPRQISSMDFAMGVPSYDPYWVDKAQLYNQNLAAAGDPAAAGAAAAQMALLESILSIYSGAPKSGFNPGASSVVGKPLGNGGGGGGGAPAPPPRYAGYFDSQPFGGYDPVYRV